MLADNEVGQMPKKTKDIDILVRVRVPVWMTARDAKREVRYLVNHQSGFLSHGPNYEEVVVRASHLATIKPAIASALRDGGTDPGSVGITREQLDRRIRETEA